MYYSITTLGCKVNQYESQLMGEMLERAGFLPSPSGEAADVCIINSCAVTATAEQKSRQAVHRARRENPGAIVCLSGCISQALPQKYEGFADADIVIGNSNREELPALIEKFAAEHRQLCRCVPHSKEYNHHSEIMSSPDGRTRAYIKAEDGCNCFCSYCIIPYARGRVRSRSLADIRAEAEALSVNFREIVVTGINLTAYGQDIGGDISDVVETIALADGIERIRLGSIEADFITEKMLRRLAAQPKFCPQFHLSLQSGCNATLRRMNRHYDTVYYSQLVRNIREIFVNPSITTDVMVGFPGETDEEFEQSLKFVKHLGFTRVHCFIFSPREGTVAYSLPDQIPQNIKNERAARLQQAAKQGAEDFMRSQLGIEHEVVAERTTDDGLWEGYSRNYTAIRFPGQAERGEVCTVFADTISGDCCIGHKIT